MASDEARMFKDGVDTALPLIGIYEISKVLGSTLDLDRALHDVLNILSSYLHMRHGAILLREDDGLAVVAVAGMSLKLVQAGTIPYPMAAVAKVVATSIPLVVPNAADDELLSEYAEQAMSVDDEKLSFFCVPIKASGRPFGALSVERSWDGNARTVFEHDLRFLTMVATLLAQTISLHRKVSADRERLMEQNARLQKQMAEVKPMPPVGGLQDLVGSSAAMGRVFAQVQQAAPAKATILLRGESGTGKELVARAIHILSPRSTKPFVKVNCAALSETLLESELFGHEKGAFTGATGERKGRFEMATGGTLFLDEIGEISGSFQAKLLRVLQEGEFERVGGNKTIKVDVRLVAATNKDLETAVQQGNFRADLYYRLNVVPIVLPPLRERQGDIPLLALYFLKRFNEENSRSLAFSSEALAVLQGCAFPGNVRELENCVTRAATMTRGDVIGELDLACRRDSCLSSMLWNNRHPIPLPPAPRPVSRPEPPEAAPPPPAAASPAEAPPDSDNFADSGDEGGRVVERERLVQAMERCGWVQAKAARLLGLTPRQIGYALKRHGIEVEKL